MYQAERADLLEGAVEPPMHVFATFGPGQNFENGGRFIGKMRLVYFAVFGLGGCRHQCGTKLMCIDCK